VRSVQEPQCGWPAGGRMQSLFAEQIDPGGQQRECFAFSGKQGWSFGAIWPVAVQHVVDVVRRTRRKKMGRNILLACMA
jgi:hypothetical protein